MNIDKYKIFLLISQKKKISDIATQLGISQPTVTFHVKSLEESLGVRLFHSNKKSLQLTDTGLHLLPYAKEIVELEDSLKKRALEYKNNEYGEIYIGTTPSPGISILPAAIKHYRLMYPYIHFTIESKPANEIIQNTIDKKYDIGLVATTNQIPSELIAQNLKEDTLALVFPPSLTPEFEADPSLNTLKKYPFIHHSHSSSTRKIVDQFFLDHNIELSSTITVNSAELIKSMVMKEVGISILPYSLVENDIKGHRLSSVKLSTPLPCKKIKLIYLKDRYMAPHIAKFKDLILP